MLEPGPAAHRRQPAPAERVVAPEAPQSSQAAQSAQVPAAAATLSPADLDLAALGGDRLRAMAAAGDEAVQWQDVLARTGDNIVGEVLRGQGTFTEWQHYPKGDVYDNVSHGQYFYHAHAKAERAPGEHGHFHVFLRGKGLRKGAKPQRVPGEKPPAKDVAANPPCHLVGLSMDANGHLIRLFTANRWVTGETWYPGRDVIAGLGRFSIDHARPSWPANRWVTAVVALFQPHIAALVRARDDAVAAWRKANPTTNVFEDRQLGITAELWSSVDEQRGRVSAALGEHG